MLQLAAIRQERPSQVYAFLRLAPFGAALVGAGALLTLGFGIALAEHDGLGFSPAWIQAALGLWVAAMVLGAYGGRTARHARHLAARLASEDDTPNPELRALVGARNPLYASFASFLLLIAIVVLMVWQPGAYNHFTLPAALEQQLARGDPRIAFAPRAVPAGYTPVQNGNYRGNNYDVDFFKPGPPRSHVFNFSIEAGCWHHMPKPQAQLKLNEEVLFVSDGGQGGRQVWECRYDAWRVVTAYDNDLPTIDLERLVADAEPVR